MTKHRLLAATRAFLKPGAAALLLAGLGAFHLHAFAAPDASRKDAQPAAIYHNYCSVCHGDRGDGRSRAQGSLTPPPRDFTTPVAATQLPRARMIESVANGRPGTAMTGWKTQLSPKEIEGVVDYIRTTFMPASEMNETSRGRIIFSKNCSVCHGERGDGRSRAQGSLNPPPRDFTSAASKSELSVERMVKSITYGRPDTAMAGFKSQLSKEDIEAVVDYIRSGFMAGAVGDGISGTSSGARPGMPHGVPNVATPSKPNLAPAIPPVATAAPAAKAAVEADMSALMPQGLKGDAVKGAAFYMSNCATCHGATGDGRGPRAYFINPKPRNFLHTASRNELNRPALFKAATEGKLGTEMPAWGKVLSPQEIADVSEFVFQRFIRAQDNNAGKQTKK